MSTGEPAGEGGGGGGESTPGGDHSAGTPVGATGIPSGVQPGLQHPPPSPLSGCYLLVVLPEPHTAQHKDLIVNRLAKGFLSWDKDSCHVDLEKELQSLVTQAPEGEEARNGERLIQYATENLVTEVLIHPQTNTLLQCIRNLLASFTKHRHIIHAGYTFSGNGSWILQDGTFSLADFLDAFSEHEVQRVLRAYENSVTVDIHCAGVGDWTSSRLSRETCARSCRVRVNPDDVLTAGVPAISSFTDYVGQYLVAQTLDQLMEPSDVVGNIRFSHPTLYVFPGGQGDAALFGINGFNMLVDGGFARKACFWDFARHLDRLDAVLLTRVNNSNIGGMSSVLRKKQEMHVYPQIGHFFCNLVERRQANSPDGDKDIDPLILNLTDLGQEMMVNLRHINLRAHPCYRDLEPINLYHKVGHGTLDMYVLSPSKDTREVREFLSKWQASDSKLFAGSHKKDSNNLTFPIQNLVSICALLVWQPANPEDTITRILFPGSTPQNKIFEGLERLKHLDFMKHPVCSAKTLSPSTSLAALKEKSNKQKTSIIEKSIDKDLKDKDIKRVSDHRREKKETPEPKTAKGVEESSPKPAVPSAPIIPTKQPAKVDVKAKKVVENKKIEKETKTESKKIERDLKEVKRETMKKEVVKLEKQEVETKKTDVVKTETEKTVITKESKPKPEPKKKEVKETRTVLKTKVETSAKPAPKPAEKKLKPSIDKKDVKSSPTTPKKILNGTATRTEISKTSTKTVTKTTSRTVSAMPAKSAKDATNRKVVESKNIALSSAPAAPPATAKAPSVTAKPRSTDRKPISRRPKAGSPSKPRLPGSPAKSTRSTPTASVKSEKDGVIRRPRSDKGTTDSSAVSTPSAIDIDSVAKLADKSLTEKSDDISIDSIESKVLADLKEEREVVEEIEAVLSKAERNEIARKDEQLEADDEITAEATDKKEEDATEEDVTAEIEDAPKKVGSRKESQEFTEEDEYLIVEKEEIYTEDSALSGEGEQKHLLDEVESEKVKKYEVSKDLDVTEEEAKEKDETEEKEKDERPEKLQLFDDEQKNADDISPIHKEQLEEEVKDIIASATEMIQKTDERDDSGKKDSDDITKEPSSVSPDKFDSYEKKTTDTDHKPESDQKDHIPEKLEESQDRISTLESGATTTAPTLPEDERIPLDEIKEDIDEKYAKEEVKEKEIHPVKDKQPEIPQPAPSTTMKTFVIRETIPAAQRDIVKTPDEVADLPVHEEVDPKLYDIEECEKVKEDKGPQTPEAKEPPTPPVKEQKGMFSFFGKVADKFEKGMDKLTGKSKKDAEKEAEEKSSKSSSPKEAKPQEKTVPAEIDMGKVFQKVGKIETHDTFEKAKPQSPIDIKVAEIKETAAFLQQEIKETRIDTDHSFEPAGLSDDKKHTEVPLTSEQQGTKEPVQHVEVSKDVAAEVEAAVVDSIERQLIPRTPKDEIVSEDLVEDTKEVEALLEEASKKFKTVKDSLRDSLESLEDKIGEEIMDEVQPVISKDSVKSTLTGVAERLEGFRPRYDDDLCTDSKEPEKVKFEIPKDSDYIEEDSDEYEGPVRDLKEAVRDVGEVLAGTAGIVIDDKPKDVIEIVKKVAEVLKEDNFLSEEVLFDKCTPKHEATDDGVTTKPIVEGIIMPKKVGVTEELPPQEEIEEILESGIAEPLPAYERAGGIEVQEEPCVQIFKDTKSDVKSPLTEKTPIGMDVKELCSQILHDPKTPSPKQSPDEYKGKVDVMECGMEEVCTKKEAKRDSAEEYEDEVEDVLADEEVEQPEILFQQKLTPAQAELVMVTPDSAPTSPKFTSDKVYDKELEDALNDASHVPGVPKEIEEFISSKADVYDIIDEVIRKGRKITIEIIEYIVIVKKVSREHVIYIIEEIIINKGISPESVVENVDILKSQDSADDQIISTVKRIEIEEYIIAEYIMKGRRITVQTIEEIAIKKVVPKRIIIEIIEEIIIKRRISRESVYEIIEEEFIKQVTPIYDENERRSSREKSEDLSHKTKEAVEVQPATTDDELSSKPVVVDTSPKDDEPKATEQVLPEPSKEKDAPIFDEKDLDEGKLIDDFVNIPSKDVVINFLHEERRLSDEEHSSTKDDTPTASTLDAKTVISDDAVKYSGDDFEAVEQEYKVHEASSVAAESFHDTGALKDKDDVLEAVEDDLDDVVEAAEKFVEETKEKPGDLKETPISDTVLDKFMETGSESVEAEEQLIPKGKDDAIPSHVSKESPEEETAFVKSKPDDAGGIADDSSVSNASSAIIPDILDATEKYLDEAKEKPTVFTSELPKVEPKDPKSILDDIEDAIQDTVVDKVHALKHATPTLEKSEPTTEQTVQDVKVDDHLDATSIDKHDVHDEVKSKEPTEVQEAHLSDVKIGSPHDHDDKQFEVDFAASTDIGKDIQDRSPDKVHDKVQEIDSQKKNVKEVAHVPTDIVPAVRKLDEPISVSDDAAHKIPEVSKIESAKDVTETLGDMEKKSEGTKDAVDVLKNKDIPDVKLTDTKEILDLKQSEAKVEPETDDVTTDKTSKASILPSLEHSGDAVALDSSCFNIGHPHTPETVDKKVLDVQDEATSEYVEAVEASVTHDEDDHVTRKKRSIGGDTFEPDDSKRTETEAEHKETKPVDSTPSVEETRKSTSEETEKVAREPLNLDEKIQLKETPLEVSKKLDDEDDDNEVGTVRRMVVTASSEDGGHETELCPTGSITFVKALTPDDSLKDVSTKSTPDKDSLQLEKDSLLSGKSSPEKDSISERSISEIKDDKVTPDDSLEKPVTGIHDHVVADEGRRKSHEDEPEETLPAVSGGLASELPKDTSQQVHPDTLSSCVEKALEEPEEKVTKVPEKPAEITGFKSPEQVDSQEVSPAETIFDKSPTEKYTDPCIKESTDSTSRSPSLTSEKVETSVSDHKLDDQIKISSVAAEVVDKETDASRKSSISSVRFDETDRLNDANISKDKSPSPIDKSSIASQELPAEDSVEEDKMDTTSSPLEKTTDKPKSPEEKDQKDKSPSPTLERDSDKPLSASVSSTDSDLKSVLPDELQQDKLRTLSITSEKLDERDVQDEARKQKSPSPTSDDKIDKSRSSSIASGVQGEKDIHLSEDLKDRSPSPDKVAEKSRTPSVVSEKLEELHISETQTPKEKSPSPIADIKLDRSRTSSVGSEKSAEKIPHDDHLQRQRSPSPAADDVPDHSRTPSIASEKLDIKDIHESKSEKEKTPSPIADAKPDQSRTPSMTSEKLDAVDSLEDFGQKDKSPSPTLQETLDKSRTSSISAEKLFSDDEVRKQLSPSPSKDEIPDHSSIPSTTSEKLDMKEIPKSTTDKEKSPSPIADAKLDQSRTPSIVSEKPDDEERLDSPEPKDKSPSPTIDGKLDKSRTASISSDKLTEEIRYDGQPQKERSPSPTRGADHSRTPSVTLDKLDVKDVHEGQIDQKKSPSPTADAKLDHSRTPSIVSEKSDAEEGLEKQETREKSPSPTVEEKTDKSRTPSIISEKVDAQIELEDHVTKSRSSIVDDICEKFAPSGITSDEEKATDLLESKDKSSSPTADKSRTPSLIPDDKIQGDRSPSMIGDEQIDISRKSSVASGKVDEAEKSADDIRKTSIAPDAGDDKINVDGKIQKDKSPSPTEKDIDEYRKMSITTGHIIEKDIPCDETHRETSPSPSVDTEGEKSRKQSAASEIVVEKDLPHEEIAKDRTPSPSTDREPDASPKPSTTPDSLDHKASPDDKDLPTIDVTDASRKTSVASGEVATTDVHDKVQEDKSPSPTAGLEDADQSRKSSVVSSKLDDHITEPKTPTDRSVSPASDEEADISRKPSDASGTHGIRDILDDKVDKAKSPSPISDEVIDGIRKPSITPGVVDDKAEPDDKIHKEKTPSPSTDKVGDESRKFSTSSGILDEKELPDDKVCKDESIAPITSDEVQRQSRSPSTASDKLVEKDILESKVHEDKSPSPTTEEKASRHSRTPSMSTGKVDEKNISDDNLAKDKSPSPTADKITLESRTPSIVPDELGEKDHSTDKLQKDVSPSPTPDKSRAHSIASDKPDDHDTSDLNKIEKDKSPSPLGEKVTQQADVESTVKEASPTEHELDDEGKIEPEEPSVAGIISDKSDGKVVPTQDKVEEKSADEIIPQSEASSISQLQLEEKYVPKETSSTTDKVEKKSESTPEKLDVSDGLDGTIDEKSSPSPRSEVSEKIPSEQPEEKIPSSLGDKLDDKVPAQDKTSSPTSVKDASSTDKQKSAGITSEELGEQDIIGDEIDKSEDIIAELDKSDSTISVSRPDQLDTVPEVTGKKTVHDDEPLKEAVSKDQKKDDSPKSPSQLSKEPDQREAEALLEKPETLDIETPRNIVESVQKTDDKYPLVSADLSPEKSRSPSIASEKSKSPGVVDEKPEDSARSSSRSSIKSDQGELTEDQKTTILTHEKPKSPEAVSDASDVKDIADSKSPRDRSPSCDRTPKDRSRSHSLFDTGDKTPLGRSRAASLFDDKLDDKIALLELNGHSVRPSISEEMDEEKLTCKDDYAKPDSKSPSISDRESPRTSIASDFKEIEVSPAKRLEIEQFIVDEFISKNRKITSEIIEEIIIKKSVSRTIIIEIIEEIIVKRKISRESVIEISESEAPDDEDIVSDSKIPEDPVEGLLDSKRPSNASEISATREIPDVKKPSDSTRSSIVDVPEVAMLHAIKKRSIVDDKSPEADVTEDSSEPEPVTNGEHFEPEHVESKTIKSELLTSLDEQVPKRSSISDDKTQEIDASKLTSDKKEPVEEDDTISSDDKVLPTMVVKSEESTDVDLKRFEDESTTVTNAKRTEVEEYIVDEYIRKGKKITREILEEIVIRKAVPRYVILEIIEEIIIKRKISRVLVIDFVEEETIDKDEPEVADQSVASSISDKDDIKLRKFSEDKYDVTTGKSTPEISSAKDQTIDFSGKSTPDLKSSLLSEKYSDKSGYSTPDMRQFDERSGKSTPDYRTEYESQFHKAFVGGMTEIRTTHITTLSGKSTPDFAAGRDDTPEPKSESLVKPEVPSQKPDHSADVSSDVDEDEEAENTQSSHKVESPEKATGAHPSLISETTSDQSIFTKKLSEVSKATTEILTKFSESAESSISTATSKIITSEHQLEKMTDESVHETTSASTTITTVKSSQIESATGVISKDIEQEVESHEPTETEVITRTIKHVEEFEEDEPEIITKVIKGKVETREPSEIEVVAKTIKHVTEAEENGEPEIITKVVKRESVVPEDETMFNGTVTKRVKLESEPEVITKVIRHEIEAHEPIETEMITKTIRHVTEIEESEPEIITKVIRREIFESADEATASKTIAVESEPEIITRTVKREVETHDPTETEVITRTIRHVTEIEESEPEIITKIVRREIVVPDDSDPKEIPDTSEAVTKTAKSSDGTPDVVKRIISREGTPEVTETITTRTTRTIVSDASPATETATKTTTTITSDIEKPELITRIISREGTPEISETIKRTTKTISSDAAPEYVTRIISREGTPEILKTSEIKRFVTTVTTVTGPDGESVTTKDVQESVDKLDGEDLLEKLIDSSSSEKIAKSTPDVKTSEERFVSETPDGLKTEEIIKRTVTTVTSSSGTSTPDVKTFIDSGKSTSDHKGDDKIEVLSKEHAAAPDTLLRETSKDSPDSSTVTEKTVTERSAPEIPSSGLVKDIISEDKGHSGKSSPDISLPKDVVSGGSTGKSTPDIPASPLIRDSASIQGRILSGRSTPDRKSEGKSRTATPEGFRSGEVIRTIITTTRTMSDDGEIITTTKEVTESTNDQGETVVLEEKTDVKRDDSLPGKDAAETAISSVIGSIKASELKRGSSPGSDVMSDRDIGPGSPRSDISSGHSRAATHVWGSSEERHTYSDDEPPSSPLSTTSQVGYSPQLPRHEFSLDKDAHKPGEIQSDVMAGSFYGELPTEPATASSMTSSFYASSTSVPKNSDPIPIQGEHSIKRFTVEKEFAGGYDYKVETKKYMDDADLDFDRAMMEHREKRGEDLVSHHYSNGASAAVYANGNTKKETVTTVTAEKKSDPMSASFVAEKETDEAGKSGKDPLEGWGKPLFLPSPKPPRKFNLQRPVASTSSDELSPESLNFDVINNWGEPLRLPSPAPAPTNEVSNKGAPGTPKKERKQPKKVLSENNKNKKRSESPGKNDKKTKDSKNKVQPVYMDLTYVPHHGNSYYSSLEFFKRIRARYYVFSGTEPSREVYDALLEAKKTWEDKNLEVTMIPTYDTDTLGYWVADNEEALAANHIDLSPSASRCTINLQDHETSCSAYRLEF